MYQQCTSQTHVRNMFLTILFFVFTFPRIMRGLSRIRKINTRRIRKINTRCLGIFNLNLCRSYNKNHPMLKSRSETSILRERCQSLLGATLWKACEVHVKTMWISLKFSQGVHRVFTWFFSPHFTEMWNTMWKNHVKHLWNGLRVFTWYFTGLGVKKMWNISNRIGNPSCENWCENY